MKRLLYIASLIFAGEAIFGLPFHMARFFRPIFLEHYQINNTQLGDMFAAYGIVAMLSYFPGGLIADKFSPRKLIATSLILTALGGVSLIFFTEVIWLYYLFAYWGCTTIFLFWAPMIKATRNWGGTTSQGLAFGMLDGGRGFVASLLASLAIFILTVYLTSERISTLIVFYISTTLLAAVFAWFFIVDSNQKEESTKVKEPLHLIEVLKNKTVWLQAGIVVTAYCGYKGLDNYGLFFTTTLGMEDIESAKYVTATSYARPFAAIIAGVLADRFQASKLIFSTFLLVAISFAFLSFLPVNAVGQNIILLNIVISIIGVYALRGIYFCLLEETQIKSSATGTAVGAISAAGYTPDIFFAPITGRILDANPGTIGFQSYFLFLAVASVLGLVCALLLVKSIKTQSFTA